MSTFPSKVALILQHLMYCPVSGSKDPPCGRLTKVDTFVRDIAGEQKTVLQLELVLFAVNEDHKAYQDVYRLQPLNDLLLGVSDRRASPIDQKLRQAIEHNSLAYRYVP